jgi:hypothetical protein
MGLSMNMGLISSGGLDPPPESLAAMLVTWNEHISRFAACWTSVLAILPCVG